MLKKKNITAVAVTAIMIIAAVVIKEKEIIFPEIAAIAIGWLAAPKKSWKVNEFQMIFMIAVCAFAGIAIVRYLNADIKIQIILSFIFAQTVYLISNTTFMPAISAAILPVLLQTETVIYPLSAIIFTALVCAAGRLTDKTYAANERNTGNNSGEKENEKEIKTGERSEISRKAAEVKSDGEAGKAAEVKLDGEARKAAEVKSDGEARKAAEVKPDREARKITEVNPEGDGRKNLKNKKSIWLKGIFRILVVVALVYIFLPAGMRFSIAPPLFVALTELTSGESKAIEKPFRVAALVTICAIIGMSIKVICSIIPDMAGIFGIACDAGLGVNIIIGAIIASFATQFVMKKFQMWMPPAGALAILPFLIGDSLIESKGVLMAATAYPAQIFAGISLITIVAYLVKRADERISRHKLWSKGQI